MASAPPLVSTSRSASTPIASASPSGRRRRGRGSWSAACEPPRRARPRRASCTAGANGLRLAERSTIVDGVEPERGGDRAASPPWSPGPGPRALSRSGGSAAARQQVATEGFAGRGRRRRRSRSCTARRPSAWPISLNVVRSTCWRSVQAQCTATTGVSGVEAADDQSLGDGADRPGAHHDHERRAGRGVRLPVDADGAAGLVVAGHHGEGRAPAAHGDGNPGRHRGGDGRGDAGHDLERARPAASSASASSPPRPNT